MGRRNKTYSISLHQQAYNRLTGMQAFGQSKREAVATGTDRDKIFSFSTYQTYWKHTKYFLSYIKENHPECTTLKAAKRHVNEWLQYRSEQGLSAWTIQVEAKALGKLYGIKPGDPGYFTPPKRRRTDIKRSRTDTVRDRHFSQTNNAELIDFCRGTGLRRSELKQLRGQDLIARADIDAEYQKLASLPADQRPPEATRRLHLLQDARLFNADAYVYVRNGKGGRSRISPIIGKKADQIIQRMRETAPDELVWQHVSTNADIHSYRGDYATAIYKCYARPISEIPYDRVHQGTGHAYQSQVYTCRKDERGKKLDKAAMLLASKALGHNRISVVADNYIRNL